jgi:hypothetical protein
MFNGVKTWGKLTMWQTWCLSPLSIGDFSASIRIPAYGHFLHLPIPGYILGSSFCCQNLQKVGVCIFVSKDLHWSKLNISHNCKEKDLEICAVELETKSFKLIILSLHRASTGDFKPSIMNLDDTLKYPCKTKVEFLICGHKHTDYLKESNQKKKNN